MKKKALVDYLNQKLAGRAKVALGLLGDLILEIEGRKVEVRLNNDRKMTDFDLVVFRGVGNGFLTLASDLAFCLEHLQIKYTDTGFKHRLAVK